jgi:large subunit ribosomal protein L5
MIHPEDDQTTDTPTPETPSEPKAETKPAKVKNVVEGAEKPKKQKESSDAPAKLDKKNQSLSKKGGGKGDRADDGGKKKENKTAEPLPADYIPRMQKIYKSEVTAELMKKFNYSNTMMVPRLVKIVLNIGIGEAGQNPKLLESATRELAQITGQKPVITRAHKSISNFKLRKGMPIGCRVTLRRFTMWEFMDRLLTVAIPRIRDFRGLSDRSFDGRGNYSVGVKEQIIFPEIDIDKIERMHGMDITFITTARTDEEAHALLSALGVPFRSRAAKAPQQAA